MGADEKRAEKAIERAGIIHPDYNQSRLLVWYLVYYGKVSLWEIKSGVYSLGEMIELADYIKMEHDKKLAVDKEFTKTPQTTPKGGLRK